MSQQVVD